MSQLDMFPTISLGQLDAHLHFQGIAEDTATRATTNVPATLHYATSTARASPQSATLTAISEWSRSDAHHCSYGLRTLYDYNKGWGMIWKGVILYTLWIRPPRVLKSVTRTVVQL
jgi:hypothetical protein